MTASNAFPVGTPGVPWGPAEVARWRAGLSRRRSHAEAVVPAIEALRTRFDVIEYGRLHYAPHSYPLLAVCNRDGQPDRPLALVTGGVHGYETSGVHGALRFLEQYAGRYDGRIDWLVVPCVSPWGYEHIQRWNADAIDPNRAFTTPSPAAESAALMDLIAPLKGRFLLHVDLHETTDSDETQFRPALAARDGKPFVPGTIPDGFYLVDDRANPQPAFQAAIIAAVEKITHIAAPDPDGAMIGSPVVAPGVIQYPLKALGLCAGITDARYTTTTEVYPDSPRTTPEQCNEAQAVAVCAALDFALAQPA